MQQGIRRVGILDDIRGLCVVLMVIYHGLYDLVDIFGWNIPLFHWSVVSTARTLVAAVFMLIAGITCRFSRSNWKRGTAALGAGLALTVGTLLIIPSQRIWFGILHFMGCAMLLFALLEPVLSRIPPALGVAGCALLFLCSYGVEEGFLGIPGVLEVMLPRSWYTAGWLFPLGLYAPGFYSADYYPLLPWIFVFLAGSFLGIPLKKGEGPSWLYPTRSRVFSWVGKRALWIYLLHQPVLYGIFQIMVLIAGR